LPLIWSVRRNLASSRKVEDRIGDVIEDGMERLSRWYAWIVVLFFTLLPLALLILAYSARFEYSSRIDFFASSTISPVLGYQILKIFLFVTPSRIEVGSWHLTRFVASCITIGLYGYAKKARRKVDKGVWQELDVERRIGVAAFIRSLLGIWTSVCAVGVILRAVRWDELPALVIRLFPWMAGP
jgi:hypothetical protein